MKTFFSRIAILLLIVFGVAGCAYRTVSPLPENRSYAGIKFVDPNVFCVIDETLVPLLIRMKTDGTEPDFASQLQEYVIGHAQSNVIRFVNNDDYDFYLNIIPYFSEVTTGSENGGYRQDCHLDVFLAPANSFQKFAEQQFELTSLKDFNNIEDAKRQYSKAAGEQLSSWTIQQLNVISRHQINAVDIRVGLRDPLIQIDPWLQEKNALEIGNFIQGLPGVISSKLIEFDKEARICTFHIVFYPDKQPNRFTGTLTEKFQ